MAAVRPATPADLDRLVAMGRKFHAASPLAAIPFAAADFAACCRNLMLTGILLISERGMIGGPVFPCYFNVERYMAQELFWWAEDGQGDALREAFEALAAQFGARLSAMSALEGLRIDAVGRRLRRRGYRPVERLFVKEL